MTSETESEHQRVVVVTGGAAGIGRAIAEELGREGAYVVTLDPGVKVDGSAPDSPSAEDTTADRIVAAGGQARASNTSVTDAAAVEALFNSLVLEFGAIDAVVNVAGISRPTEFGSGAEKDWADVVSVHLDGYLNVLRAALAHMAAAGNGRILGVTSGSGWRPANTGAYGCAKRAVAALTWQLGQVMPEGVTVNALSPIAATRMVTSALQQISGSKPDDATAASARTGGVDLSSMPQPEDLGPIGAFLASDAFGWSSGNVVFSSGAECAVLAKPKLIEIARTSEVASLAHALAAVVPAAFVPAELAQAAQGGSNPRVKRVVFDEAGETPPNQANTCLVVTDDDRWSAALTAALGSRGVKCVVLGAGAGPDVHSAEIAAGFDAVSAQVEAVRRERGPIDSVVVALGADVSASACGDPWQRILAEHDGIPKAIQADGSWYRAVADLSAASEAPVRSVMLVDASTSGGATRAQASTQLSRSAHMATAGRVDACTVSVESTEAADVEAAAELTAHLVCGFDTASLSGAELMVAPSRVGLRSHPRPEGTISFGGPSVPEWLDAALRQIIEG